MLAETFKEKMREAKNDSGDRDGGSVVKDHEDDPEEAIWQALRGNKFEFKTGGSSGNPIAGRWARFLVNNPEWKKKYDDARGRRAKAGIRADWAEGEYDKYEQAKVHKKTFSKQETKDGRMLSLQRIAKEEGGGKAGMRNALNIALRCVQEGGKYCEYDNWAQTIKFFYVIKGSCENIGETWEQSQTWKSSRDKGHGEGLPMPSKHPVEAASSPRSEVVTPGAAPKANAKANAKSGSKRKSGEKPDADAGNEGDVPSKVAKVATPTACASRTKTDYNELTSQANQILHNIKNDRAWQQFKGHSEDQLEAAHSGVKSALLECDFGKAYILDQKSLKKHTDPADWDKGCKAFSLALEKPLSILGKTVKLINMQQRAKTQVDRD
jgi:hypothetical protein